MGGGASKTRGADDGTEDTTAYRYSMIVPQPFAGSKGKQPPDAKDDYGHAAKYVKQFKPTKRELGDDRDSGYAETLLNLICTGAKPGEVAQAGHCELREWGRVQRTISTQAEGVLSNFLHVAASSDILMVPRISSQRDHSVTVHWLKRDPGFIILKSQIFLPKHKTLRADDTKILQKAFEMTKAFGFILRLYPKQNRKAATKKKKKQEAEEQQVGHAITIHVAAQPEDPSTFRHLYIVDINGHELPASLKNDYTDHLTMITELFNEYNVQTSLTVGDDAHWTDVDAPLSYFGTALQNLAGGQTATAKGAPLITIGDSSTKWQIWGTTEYHHQGTDQCAWHSLRALFMAASVEDASSTNFMSPHEYTWVQNIKKPHVTRAGATDLDKWEHVQHAYQFDDDGKLEEREILRAPGYAVLRTKLYEFHGDEHPFAETYWLYALLVEMYYKIARTDAKWAANKVRYAWIQLMKEHKLGGTPDTVIQLAKGDPELAKKAESAGDVGRKLDLGLLF